MGAGAPIRIYSDVFFRQMATGTRMKRGTTFRRVSTFYMVSQFIPSKFLDVPFGVPSAYSVAGSSDTSPWDDDRRTSIPQKVISMTQPYPDVIICIFFITTR